MTAEATEDYAIKTIRSMIKRWAEEGKSARVIVNVESIIVVPEPTPPERPN